jgi:YD repeat-containing protein
MKVLKIMLVLLLLPMMAFAGVNIKNGNYYMAYTDIVVPGGGEDLEITRTYNSKSTEVGWFGFGWGSDYETYLSVSADGSVVIHENGSGAQTRFTPKEKIDPYAAAKRIIEAMKKKNGSINDKVAADLMRKFAGNASLRQSYARKYGVKAKLASGTVLYSNERGIQKLHKTKDGYKRLYHDGKQEFFNDQGKLAKIKNKHGYSVSFTYKNGLLESIKDSQAKQLFFSWYPNKKVKAVWSAGDKKATYKYDGDNLVQSIDIAGNTYKYSYDQNHNMTKIGYTDNSKMVIGYDKRTQFVTSVQDRDGDMTKYSYGENPKNPELHYWTTVEKKGITGKPIKNKYEYEIKKRPDGSQYTYRIFTDINGLKTETVYSPENFLPLKITRGKRVTTFKYNEKGLLTKKSSSHGDSIELEYHKKFDKVTRVKDKNGWTKFDYDKKGNLAKAVSSTGKSVLLIYDRKGRITKMVDYNKKSKEKRTLAFKYNAFGKPVEIAMDKVGKIHVAYDNYGEIKKVESKAGHKMAMQVTQAFQSLLTIVKPAGVNLNM